MTGTELITGITKTLISKAAGKLFSEYQARRAEAATNILLSKVSAGELDMLLAAQEDETIGVIYQYMQCAARGTARLNLNLLAQAIKGDIDRGQLYPNNFTKYLNTLADLTYDEIFVLARYRHYIVDFSEVQFVPSATSAEFVRVGGKTIGDAYSGLRYELCPSTFETDEHLKAILSGLMRTGLITTASAFGGLMVYYPSILFNDICQLINFKEALKEENKY